MLRHYESLGLVTAGGRTSAGYRDYTSDDLVRVFHVEALRMLGLSLAEAGRVLDDPDFVEDRLIARLIARTEERIDAQRALLARLRSVEASGAGDRDAVLDVLARLSDLASPAAGRRQRAALASDSGAVDAGALVTALLDETDPNAAGALRWALARHPDSGAEVGGVDRLAAALADPAAKRRRRAVHALTELPGPAAHRALLTVLDDPDPVVRRHAVLAVADRGDPTVVDGLVALVVAGDDDVAAADALGDLARRRDDPDAVAVRLTAALDGAEVGVRRRVTQALGELPGAAALRTLAGLSTDPDPAVRLTARHLRSSRGAAPEPDQGVSG